MIKSTYQLRHIVHWTFHLQAHDFKLNSALLIHWLLIILRRLNKFEHCNSSTTMERNRVTCTLFYTHFSNSIIKNKWKKTITSGDNSLSRSKNGTRWTHETTLRCSCLKLKRSNESKHKYKMQNILIIKKTLR